MVEFEVGVVVDHPLELLLRVEAGGPCGVDPPLLLEAVTVVHPDLKPDGSGQAEEDEETDGEEDFKGALSEYCNAPRADSPSINDLFFNRQVRSCIMPELQRKVYMKEN